MNFPNNPVIDYWFYNLNIDYHILEILVSFKTVAFASKLNHENHFIDSDYVDLMDTCRPPIPAWNSFKTFRYHDNTDPCNDDQDSRLPDMIP